MVSYKALKTTAKRRTSNTCYTIRDIDAGQRTTPAKGIVTNARYAVWYVDLIVWGIKSYSSRFVDAGKSFALGKRPVTNACHTVWYVDAG